VRAMSQILKMPEEQLAEHLYKNAINLFLN
jgi:Tat protein secretion system quality control protein TatD with DNase activity